MSAKNANVVVFSGPSLRPSEGLEILQAEYLPPASQGDVYSIARHSPLAIVLIDGYFERVPSVWHKEILWAMARGIHVFGASSFGALRAAELEAFGMVGSGQVFEWYRDGVLESDDEVALLHATSAHGFQPLTVALVDIRATLAEALRQGLISNGLHETLISIARLTFYQDRTYEHILRVAGEEPATKKVCERLAPWIERHRIDLKKRDALGVLHLVREQLASPCASKKVRFTFQNTKYWQEFRQLTECRAFDSFAGAESILPDASLEELRLEGEAYIRLRERALARSLALEVAEARGVVAAAPSERHLGFRGASDLEAWASEQHLLPHQVDRLLADEDRIQQVRGLSEEGLEPFLRDCLRIEGRYGLLFERSREKQELLARSGLDNSRLAETGLDEDGLWQWYFSELLGRPVPDDLERYARYLDFAQESSLRRAVLREYLYLRASQNHT